MKRTAQEESKAGRGPRTLFFCWASFEGRRKDGGGVCGVFGSEGVELGRTDEGTRGRGEVQGSEKRKWVTAEARNGVGGRTRVVVDSGRCGRGRINSERFFFVWWDGQHGGHLGGKSFFRGRCWSDEGWSAGREKVGDGGAPMTWCVRTREWVTEDRRIRKFFG